MMNVDGGLSIGNTNEVNVPLESYISVSDATIRVYLECLPSGASKLQRCKSLVNPDCPRVDSAAVRIDDCEIGDRKG